MSITVTHPRFAPAARQLLYVLIVLLGLSVSACVTTDSGVDELATDGGVNAATALAARGDHVAAAQAWLALAETAEALEKDRYLLEASRALIQSGQMEAAGNILSLVQAPGTTELILFAARLQFDINRPGAVLQQLAPLENAVLNNGQQRLLFELRAKSYAELGNHIEAARHRSLLDSLLDDPQQQDNNHAELWAELNTLNEPALSAVYTASPPGNFRSWLELVLINKRAGENSDGLTIERWRSRNLQHPAASRFIATLLAIRSAKTSLPTQIALLLPFNGRYADAASAIRDGFLTAHYADSDSQQSVSIRLYNADESNIEATYTQAVQEGAEFIVGPLGKPAVKQLVSNQQLSVPTLTLNNTDIQQPDNNLYQFSLLPEDEARQVAEKIWLDGHNKGIVIYPETTWGLRVLTSFSEHWQQLGGKLVEVQSYALSSRDFARPIRQLLNIDDSRRRYKTLKKILGRKLDFETRRRQDIDFIFLAAFPEQARQIRPQLKFYDAGSLPVYSTSHVFSGHIDKKRDRDMDGIIFGDMPWTLHGNATEPLHNTVTTLWQSRSDKLARFYAFGIDAYRLIPHLQRLRDYPFERFAGQTGSLHLDKQQRLRRQLRWAQFRFGRPRIIEQTRVQLPVVAPVPTNEPANLSVPINSSVTPPG